MRDVTLTIDGLILKDGNTYVQSDIDGTITKLLNVDTSDLPTGLTKEDIEFIRLSNETK